jgi:FKBP-type peptidyl-prolyl cis-trans isomerase
MILRSLSGLVLFVISLVVAAPSAHAVPRGEFSPQDEAIIREKWPDAATTPSGLRFIVLKEGSGPKPLQRQRIKTLYRGTLIDGKEFSATTDPTKPFEFVLGTRKVIAGWEEGFSDMRAGEKRLLIIPFALGYGLLGRAPDIPNRATLVFEVELLSIE